MTAPAIDHLSYSSITLYLDCPEAWRRKYILKDPVKSSPALVVGSAFHGTVERLVQVTDGDVVKIWDEEFKKATAKDAVEWGLDTPEQHYNDGLRMLTHPTIKTAIADIHPGQDEAGYKIERKVELRVPGVPIPVIGYIDAILDDGTPADFKTSKMSWTEAKASDSLQTLFYLAAMNQMGIPVNWKFKHLVFVKTKEPKFQMLEHSHKPAEIFFLMDIVARVWKAIELDVYPINPTGWRCNEQYCDFFANCRGKYQK